MYQKINLSKIYEQAVDTEQTDTGALHAFPITSDIINDIDNLANGTVKEWKSDTPLHVIGADGSIGGVSRLENLPVYLMIRIASRAERASKEIQLRLSDRIYVLLDTTKEELTNWLNKADNKDDRIRVSVKTPINKEHSIELWKEVKDETISEPTTSNVTVDLEAQKENPGTAAGVTGTISENKKLNNMKKLNEQGDAKFDAQQKQANKDNLVKKKKAELSKMSNKDLRAYGVKNATDPIVFAAVKEIVDERTATAKSEALKKKTAKTTAKVAAPAAFADQASGDAFRAWANSTIELAKKYGKMSKFDLDEKGKFDNSYIRNAYAAAKDEYNAYLKSKTEGEKKEKTAESKYKAGDIIYYKEDEVIAKEEPKAEAKPEQVAEVKPKAKPKSRQVDQYGVVRQYQQGANPRVSEAIVSSFDRFKSITEEDESVGKEEIDAQSGLIQDLKDGKIKKGVFRKEIDKDNIEVTNVKSDENETVKVSNILDSTKVKAAAAKAKEEETKEKEETPEEDTRTSSEKAKDTLSKEKEDTAGLKDELKSARTEKKAARKNVRARKKAERKIGREDKKQERISKKIKKQKGKTDAIGESVVYNFEDFIKKVNKLN